MRSLTPLRRAKGGQGGSETVEPRRINAWTRRWLAEIFSSIGLDKDAPAPDVGTDQQMMAGLRTPTASRSACGSRRGHGQTNPSAQPRQGRSYRLRGRMSPSNLRHLEIDKPLGHRYDPRVRQRRFSTPPLIMQHAGARIVAVSDVNHGGLYNRRASDIGSSPPLSRETGAIDERVSLRTDHQRGPM